MKKTALYIHGYGGNSYGPSYQKLKNSLGEGWNVLSLEYNDKDGINGYLQLGRMMSLHPEIDVIIGSSLGAFLVLVYPTETKKVVINPCWSPSVELRKINVNKTIIDTWAQYETLLNTSHKNEKCLGFFGTHDELLGERYIESFKNIFETEAIRIDSGHVVSEDGMKTICSILNFSI